MESQAKIKIDALEHVTSVLKSALEHFGNRKDPGAIEVITKAVDYAYLDHLLFEEFELWVNRKIDDEALLHQAKHFLKTLGKKPLPQAQRDLTGKKKALEKIKKDIDSEFAKSFAKKIKILALKKGLTTNKRLGEELGITSERARVLLQGKHKPQRETLYKVAQVFNVPIETFFEDEE